VGEDDPVVAQSPAKQFFALSDPSAADVEPGITLVDVEEPEYDLDDSLSDGDYELADSAWEDAAEEPDSETGPASPATFTSCGTWLAVVLVLALATERYVALLPALPVEPTETWLWLTSALKALTSATALLTYVLLAAVAAGQLCCVASRRSSTRVLEKAADPCNSDTVLEAADDIHEEEDEGDDTHEEEDEGDDGEGVESYLPFPADDADLASYDEEDDSTYTPQNV
jgi:hypothetical protein